MDPLTAISSPRRLEILRLIWREELPAHAIHQAMPDITPGGLSLQLKQLTDAGLAEARAEGRFRYFRARRQAFGPLAKVIEAMWDDALYRLKLAAELEHARRGPKPSKKKTKKGRTQ